ncbi:hypothetical protein D1B31_15860 [Neobacillus notoginsengisoli]|uniref:Peptidase M14 domain-containing protein n=2 Tax=Neobacillus notoginsengisoli TaxID=1578198 RepID=A0A417YRS7_9BACI|nr:hypothetical protein D1B31_15860 [Neobacillus notoginsengisoli]
MSFSRESQAAGMIVNPNQVYSYSMMEADIQKLKKAYPHLIQVRVIGKSEYGRNIYAVGLGTGPAKAFINGAHHAREWLTTSLNMYMINQYAAAASNNTLIDGFNTRYILSTTTIWFVPMVNPDGVTLQQQGLKAFPKDKHASLIKMNEGSKNFKRWKANAKGVDLNRQYNAGWKALKGPKSPSYKNFKGNKPESAAEVKAMLKFTNEMNPEMAVAYHSSGKILYWNYNLTGSRYKRDHVYAKKIGQLTGYRLVYPQPNPPGGGYTDWFIQAKKKPGFTPEISKPVYETSPPLTEFAGAWKENRAVGLSAVGKMYSATVRNMAKSKYILPAKIMKENTLYEIDRYTLTTEIEKQLKPENLDLIKGQLAKLEQLEKKQAEWKKQGNSLHPGKYYTFPKTEAVLLAKKKAIKDWIAAIEAAAAAKPEAETPQKQEPDSSAEKEPAKKTETVSEPKTAPKPENESPAEDSGSQITVGNGN